MTEQPQYLITPRAPVRAVVGKRGQFVLDLAAAARASAWGMYGQRAAGSRDPLVALVPGDGLEPASPELVAACEQVIGRVLPLTPLATRPGEYARPNVARVRSHLRRWAAQQRRTAMLP